MLMEVSYELYQFAPGVKQAGLPSALTAALPEG
jgi:hypothetical protein